MTKPSTYPYITCSNGCPDLQAPDNGALACDVWVGGRFCHPLCSEGYSTYYDLPNMLVYFHNYISIGLEQKQYNIIAVQIELFIVVLKHFIIRIQKYRTNAI
jgi:hypothetical protein